MNETGFNSQLSELMALAQTGDQAAFSKLLENIRPRLSAYIRKQLFQKQDWEDIYQEVLLKMFNFRDTFDSSEPFEPWMYAVARNVCRDYFRKTMKQKELIEKISEDFTIQTHTKPSVESKLLLEQAFSKLSHKQQSIIQDSKVEGYSLEEIALKNNVRVGAIKVRVHRAQKAFKKILSNRKELDHDKELK